jgi:hypothetical protein
VTAEATREQALGETNSVPSAEARAVHAQPNEAEQPNSSSEAGATLPATGGARRPAHYGLDIQFQDRPEERDLGRLIESTVWVNRAHPAYRRALASRALGYHIALTVALSLAPLAVEPAQQTQFVLTFLSRWGEAIDKPARRAKHA